MYNLLKKKWREITDRSKKGNGLPPEDSPLCYSLFDQFLSDTNLNLEDAVCSDPTDTSYAQENYHDEIVGCYYNIFDDEEEDTDEETNIQLSDKPVRESIPRKKLAVKTHQERNVVHSQTQTLSQLQGSLNQLFESHSERHKEQVNFKKERDKLFLDF